MRIALEVERTLDLEAFRVKRRLFLSRLWVRVQFQLLNGWTDFHLAIVDTGAPYSMIPESLWAPLPVERLVKLPLRGIVPGRAAEMDAVLGRVSGRLLDAQRTSPTLSLWAMLAYTDQVPLILGWSGCLDRAKLTLDAPHHRASLDF